ncbi:TIM barrel protein [Rubellimicrobium rubrum]|uniref:mannonate dehydratase n=1 Tax=Rubellimicrobium rubrum TaxID=2585369 RepID=A0A5C4N2Q1_9RHOB|nr:mannonate dehydratase [Rubellimicrobium rubrum]TNC51664.1 TIM barrel protein [Rubellimicrobium rubrum]
MAIRLAIGQFNEIAEEKLRFAAQLGVEGIQMNNPILPGEHRWEQADVRRLVERVEAHGLRFEAIENVPTHFYHRAMLGLPGRDEQIENYRATIRAVARAGVPILGYHFMPNSVWTTSREPLGRGGALVRRFDLAVVEAAGSDPGRLRPFLPTRLGTQASMPLRSPEEPPLGPEEMWANYEYFIRAVLPVAEEEGISLALHPDDPPVPMLGGVARIFDGPDGLRRAHALAQGSPAWALDLCLGSLSESPGGHRAVIDAIREFGPRGAIAYVHFRDVKGTVPCFDECFIGEGNFDPAEAMELLWTSGFDGFIIDDHVPLMDDDTAWCHRGRAHAVGYLQGMIRMLQLRDSQR